MKRKNFEFPTAYTVLFLILILVTVLTHIIPAGKYDRLSYQESTNEFVIEKYGNENVERAYTSGIIRRIIEKNEGIHIFDQKEGLKVLKDKGFEEIITMSLHILDGIEYSKLDDKFGKISKPLLADDKDLKKIVNNKEFNDFEGNDAIVFMGHGTENAADCIYQKLQDEYLKAGKDNIFIATVEGKVTIKDIIERNCKLSITSDYCPDWYDWIATKNSDMYIAQTPLRLLSLILIVDSYGIDWNRHKIPCYLNNIKDL